MNSSGNTLKSSRWRLIDECGSSNRPIVQKDPVLRVNWQFKSTSEAVLYEGRPIETFESTVKFLLKPKDYRDLLKSAGAKQSTATEAVKRIFEP